MPARPGARRRYPGGEPAVTYALLIYRTLAADAPGAAARDRTSLAAHRALQAEASAAGALHEVARLDEPRAARTGRAAAGAHQVTDGPFIESKEWLVGFYVVDCRSEEEALARARVLCPDDTHVIEVRPITWRWRG
jgi:hypothetical protein